MEKNFVIFFLFISSWILATFLGLIQLQIFIPVVNFGDIEGLFDLDNHCC